MRADGVVSHELRAHTVGQFRAEAPGTVDPSQFGVFRVRGGRQLAPLARQVGGFRVGL